MSSKKREDREARFKQFGENFRAKMIGIDSVQEARGDSMCLGAMSKMKALVKASGEHKQQIIINVSLEGVKIIDLKTLTNLHTHEVIKISFISRDPSDKRAFGYVYGEAGNHKFFAIKTQNQADELVLALKDLFEIVLANKQKEVEEQKKRMEETTVYLKPSYDNPLGSPPAKDAAENIYSESPVTPAEAPVAGADPPLASLVTLEDQVSSLQMGITAMENLDLAGSEPDPFSPNAPASPPPATADPFAPVSSEPPQQPPPPLRPPQAAPRAAPRLSPPVAPAAAEPPAVAQTASADLFGEAPVSSAPAADKSKPSDDLFKEFKDTFTVPTQPAAAPTNPFGGGGGMAGGFGMSQPGMGGGFQQQPSFGQMAMGMVQQPMGMGQQPMGMGQQPMGMGQQHMGMAAMGMASMGRQQPQPQPQQDLFGGTMPASSNSFDAFTLQPQQVHPKPGENNGQVAKKSDPFGDIALLGAGPTDVKDPKKKDPFAGFKMAKPGEVKVPDFGQPANGSASNGASNGNSISLSLDLAKTHDITEEFSLPSPQGPPPPLPAEILSQGIGGGLNLDQVGDIPPPPPRRSKSTVPFEGPPLPLPPRNNPQSSSVSPNLSIDSQESEGALRTTSDNANTLTPPSLTRNPSSSPSNLASLATRCNNLHGSDDGMANSMSDITSTHSKSMEDLFPPDREQCLPEDHGEVGKAITSCQSVSPAAPADPSHTVNSLSNSLPKDSVLSSKESSPSSRQTASPSASSVSSTSIPINSTKLSPSPSDIDSQLDVLSSSAPVSDSSLMQRRAQNSMTSSSSNPTLSKFSVPILPITEDPFADDPFLRGSPTVKKVFILPNKSDPQPTITSVPACTAASSMSFSSPASHSSSMPQRTDTASVNTTHKSSNGSNCISDVRTDPFAIGDFGAQTAPKPAAKPPMFDDNPFGVFDFNNPENK